MLGLLTEALQSDFGFRVVRPNGQAAPPVDDDTSGEHEPVDADELLAGARPGDVDERVLRSSASLMRKGLSVDEAVRTIIDELRVALADDPGRDWPDLEWRVRDKCLRFVQNNPELAAALPDELRTTFEGLLAAGRRPSIYWNKAAGRWLVRANKHDHDKKPDGAAKAEQPGAAAAPSSPSPTIEATPFRRFDPSKIPAREWLYGGHYQRGIITATVGPGGGGKSSLDLVELMAMCTGRSLLDEQPLVRCRAWYHNAEDGLDEIYRRIAAVCQHYGIAQDELDGWLFVTSGLTMPIKIATARTSRPVIEAATVGAIIQTITANEIGVVSFDPLVATHGATENITGEMDMVIREFARIANVTECAVEIVHHTRKPAPGQEELGVLDSRGAGAIIDAVRSARVLNPMSKADADKVGVDEVDRRLYFRIDRGKANMAPPAAARWHKFESIDLPNGDSVGVATAWQYPGQGDAASESAAEHVFLSLLARFTAEGRKASAGVGANYAPHLFHKEREAKVAKVTKGALAEAMRRLFEAKRIRVEQSGSGSHRVSWLVPA